MDTGMGVSARSEWGAMIKLGTVMTTVLLLGGAAHAQLQPRQEANAPAAAYAVEGVVLGSKLKPDGATYRDYKCSPSDQFAGFTWCQKTRRESGREGSFEATYSIAHARDGTVVYVSRHQQPAFFDAREAERDIQSYARKLGSAPRITKMPRRSGGSDGILATWGQVELEPLDGDSIKLLAQGKSPKKGLLVDFLGNFTRSAQEGLPIYRIAGGAGFVWAASFDQKARGALRSVAVDASGLQPRSATIQPPAAPRLAEPARVEPQLTEPQPTESRQVEPRPAEANRVESPKDNQQQEQPQAQPAITLAAAIAAKQDAEAVAARLQTELSAALEAKTAAELALSQAEKAVQEARADADIARRETDAARNDANAALDQVDRLKAGGSSPASVSYVKVTLIWMCVTAALFFVIWTFSRIMAAGRRLLTARKDDAGAVTVPSSAVSESSPKAEASFDQDDLVKHLAETLGVQGPETPLPAPPMDATTDGQPAIDGQQEPSLIREGDEGAIPSDASQLSTPSGQEGELSRSIVPNAGDLEKIAPVREASTVPSENAGSS
jgi:hypothetical protein